MSVEKIKQFLNELSASINKNPDSKKLVDKWLENQFGKVIGWKIRDQNKEYNFHMIFTQKNGAKFNIGEYPACDMMFIGDSDIILGILSGKKKTTVELKNKTLKVYGSLHEGLNFGKVMRSIFTK
ncbi:MAG: SCP2 sterol-binding domain-containing protein [Candidatus Helarchaeota archaeon]